MGELVLLYIRTLKIQPYDELALKCVNELILATGAKYWYEVKAYIEDIEKFRQTEK